MRSLGDALNELHVQLLDLLGHPEATGQDKASIVLAGTALSEISKRHGLSVTRDGNFAPISGLDPGWKIRHERAEEAANA